MRPASQIQWRDPNFTRIRIARRDLILRRDIAALAPEILRSLSALGVASESGAGNRKSAFRINIAGAPEIYVRRSRRGGTIASFLDDIYLGMSPRPLTELALTVDAMNRGVPVVEPMGAIVEWISPRSTADFF